MNPHDKLQEQLWDLVYELLPDDEAAEWTRRIGADALLAEAYQRVVQQAALLARAARLEQPPIRLQRPGDGASPSSSLSSSRSSSADPAAKPMACSIQKPAAPGNSRRYPRLATPAHWLAGLSAAALLGLFMYAYWKPDSPLNSHAIAVQERQLAGSFVRTLVTGPAELDPQLTNMFQVRTISMFGEPVSSEFDVRLFDPQGTLLLQRSARTDEQGQYRFELSPLLAKANTRLEMETRAGGVHDLFQTFLRLGGLGFSTYLTTDKPLYHPGETIFFRSVTLSRFGLQPASDMPLQFELTGPSGAKLPLEQATGVTDNGVASGQFPIPVGLPGGRYTLVARSPSGSLAEQKREVLIREYRAPRLRKQLELARDSYGPGDEVVADFSAERTEGGPVAGKPISVRATVDGHDAYVATVTTSDLGACAIKFRLPSTIERGDARLSVSVDDGGTQETIAKTIPIHLGQVDVEFYPEGGDLVAGLPSRVYFHAHDRLGKPIHVAGAIVDSHDQEVARVETSHEGRERFSFTPQAGADYRLRITSPADVVNEPALPEPRSGAFLVLESAADLFDADQPLEVDVHSSRPEVPLVVVASCRDVSVGQQEVVPQVTTGPTKTRVTMPLPAEVSGVIRVTVYDYASDPPLPVAERLVYRRPSRKLNLQLDWHASSTPQTGESLVADSGTAHGLMLGGRPTLTPGQRVRLEVRATDEDHAPIPAALGLAIVDDSVLNLADDKSPRLMTHFLLSSNIQKPEDLEDANFYFSDDERAARSLDLLLGTQGWRRFAAQTDALADQRPGTNADFIESPTPREASLPLVFDNSTKIELHYRSALAGLRDARAAELKRLGRWLSTGSVCVCMAGVILLLRLPAGRRVAVRLGTVAAVGLVISWLWTHKSGSPSRPLASVTRSMSKAAFARTGIQESPHPNDNSKLSEWARFDVLGLDRGAEALPAERYVAELFARDGWEDQGLDFKAVGRARGFFYKANFGLDVEHLEKMGRHAGGAGGMVVAGNDAGLFRSPAPPQPSGRFPVRQYAHVHTPPAGEAQRQDFAETIFWHPLLVADDQGRASVEFDLSDAITRFHVSAEGHTGGRIGFSQGEIVSRIPFSFEPKLPLEVTAGDQIELPLAINNDTSRELAVDFEVRHNELFQLAEQPLRRRSVGPGERSREYVRLAVIGEAGIGKIEVAGQAAGLSDAVKRELRVVPPGFPISWATAGNLSGEQQVTVDLPQAWIPGSLKVALTAFPSALADIRDGIEGMIAEPHGCFEQASSANYPNIWALRFMQEHDIADPSFTRRAKDVLKNGYSQLAGFECPTSGYEWFGGDPGHEALTAYGLMEFRDMQAVWDVDPEMVRRTAEWLLSRRDGQGGFLRNTKALDNFGSAPPEITNAYIVWALTESGARGIAPELDHVVRHAAGSDDPYLVALAANAAVNAGQSTAADLLTNLARWQAEDGHLEGRNGSITRSGGISLQSETTALAAVAWLKAIAGAGQSGSAIGPLDTWRACAEKAIDWLIRHRQSGGGFGSTQATVLALKAFVEHARFSQREVQEGALVVQVNGGEAGRTEFGARQIQPIRVQGLGGSLRPGQNVLTMSLTGNNQLPYVLDVSYRTPQPASADGCPVRLSTRLSGQQVRAGEIVGLEIQLVNVSEQGQPMTVAIVGLPAGLEARPEQLDELRRAGHFAYYEQVGRELAFYWRSLGPPVADQAAARFTLDLVAEIPGEYTGPASRTYLYYTPELKHWTDALHVQITRESEDGVP